MRIYFPQNSIYVDDNSWLLQRNTDAELVKYTFFQCFGNHKPSSVCFHDIPWLFALAPLSSSSFKAPATPASNLCRSNLRIKLRKVHWTCWHVGRNLKTDVCRCRLPAAEGGGAGDWTAVIVPSGEWQQQDDNLILLKLGSSIGPSLISGTRVFILCHSYLMDVQQSEWEAKGFIEKLTKHMHCSVMAAIASVWLPWKSMKRTQSAELIATIIKSRVILPEVRIPWGI